MSHAHLAAGDNDTFVSLCLAPDSLSRDMHLERHQAPPHPRMLRMSDSVPPRGVQPATNSDRTIGTQHSTPSIQSQHRDIALKLNQTPRKHIIAFTQHQLNPTAKQFVSHWTLEWMASQ